MEYSTARQNVPRTSGWLCRVPMPQASTLRTRYRQGPQRPRPQPKVDDDALLGGYRKRSLVGRSPLPRLRQLSPTRSLPHCRRSAVGCPSPFLSPLATAVLSPFSIRGMPRLELGRSRTQSKQKLPPRCCDQRQPRAMRWTRTRWRKSLAPHSSSRRTRCFRFLRRKQRHESLKLKKSIVIITRNTGTAVYNKPRQPSRRFVPPLGARQHAVCVRSEGRAIPKERQIEPSEPSSRCNAQSTSEVSSWAKAPKTGEVGGVISAIRGRPLCRM